MARPLPRAGEPTATLTGLECVSEGLEGYHGCCDCSNGVATVGSRLAAAAAAPPPPPARLQSTLQALRQAVRPTQAVLGCGSGARCTFVGVGVADQQGVRTQDELAGDGYVDGGLLLVPRDHPHLRSFRTDLPAVHMIARSAGRKPFPSSVSRFNTRSSFRAENNPDRHAAARSRGKHRNIPWLGMCGVQSGGGGGARGEAP